MPMRACFCSSINDQDLKPQLGYGGKAAFSFGKGFFSSLDDNVFFYMMIALELTKDP